MFRSPTTLLEKKGKYIMPATQVPVSTHGTYAVILGLVEGHDSVVLIENRSEDGSKWKLPGGTNKKYPSDSPEDTLFRTIRTEVGVDVLKNHHLKSANRVQGSYVQMFYLVDDWDLDFRTGPIEEPDNTLEVPVWVPVEEALGKTGTRKIFWSHVGALKQGVKLWKFLQES